ncbi:MAG: hypothetical protein KU29_06565 [Sulfurovum sp. FS06-10]|nr:MAG: hypothetical protein KU29_06565 [Sulfurovum sp. FS06-10]
MKRLIIFIVALFLFTSTIIFTEYLFAIKDAQKLIDSHFLETKAQLIALAEESAQRKSLALFAQTIQTLQKNSRLKDTEITLKKHIFDTNILLKTIPFADNSWTIIDITIDAMDGIVLINENNSYELQLSTQALNDKKIIPITFYISKDDIIKSSLFFYQPYIKITTQNTFSDVTFQEETLEKNDYTVRFSYDTSLDSDKIFKNILQFSLFIIILTIGLLMMCYGLYHLVIRQKLVSSIHILNQYVSHILEGKMVKDSSLPVIAYQELSHLHNNIIELTHKYVNASNELSISKDIIVQKERSDELTGLPNKKSFESDLKYMFVANKSGYVIVLRIDKIGLFTKNHGPEIVDTLIETFAKAVQDFFRSHSEFQGTIYRFFGGEFAIIAYESDSEKIEKLLQKIITLTEMLTDKFYFFDNTIFYGATPFDRYGSIESILQGAQDAYKTAYKEKLKPYFIADAHHQLELNKKLESTVKDIITRNDFVLQYMHDTYSFGANPQLLMQEISPLLIDSFTFESIPSGKFISVAEELGLIADFDRAIIEKVLEQIKLGELEHQIGIVLSVSSLSNQLFLSWIEEQITYQPAMSKLIFIAPCYSVASNYEVFRSFSHILKNHSLYFMIKRYDPTDLPLDKLVLLQPNYLRLEKTFCQDFKKDSTKQHAVKQILLFCESNNIKVIGDSVKNEEDYLAFEMLDFYGITK